MKLYIITFAMIVASNLMGSEVSPIDQLGRKWLEVESKVPDTQTFDKNSFVVKYSA